MQAGVVEREGKPSGRQEPRGEAVETNAKLDKLLLAVNAAFDTLVERGQDFPDFVTRKTSFLYMPYN